MTSKRRRKKTAEAVGLSERELALAELFGELLDSFRWLQILGYSNQYLMTRHLDVSPEERDRILEAATRAVDKDRKLHEWQARLAQIKGEIVQQKRAINRAKRDIARGRPAPEAARDDGAAD
jgi:hypothetical protein